MNGNIPYLLKKKDFTGQVLTSSGLSLSIAMVKLMMKAEIALII